MDLWELKPYVRFARVQSKPLPRLMSVALDHRIFYCLSGGAELEIGGELVSVREGMLLYFRAGLPYRMLSDGDTPVLLGCNFDFTFRRERIWQPVSYVHAWNYTPEMLLESDITPPDGFLSSFCITGAAVREVFSEIIREYNERALFFEERCGTLLCGVLLDAARILASGQKVQKSRADAVLSYIHAHYDEGLTNTALGKRFSYHPNYISRLVKQHTGQTLHQYLLKYRVQQAITLLQSGEYNVTEAALAVGFADVKHFSKCFRTIAGCPPSAFLIG